MGGSCQSTYVSVRPGAPIIERILDLARWAPSGNNEQPWRFQICDDSHVRVYLTAPDNNVYDLDGEATRLSGGFLLETMRLAANQHGRSMHWSCRQPDPLRTVLDVYLERDDGIRPDPRAAWIQKRSVDRHPYRFAPLCREAQAALEACLGDELEIRWFETPMERLRMTVLNMEVTHMRLRLAETVAVHARTIDFDSRFPSQGLPADSLGLDPITLRLLRWMLAAPGRCERVSRWIGTSLPRIELDLVPGLACSAHFVVAPKDPQKRPPTTEAVLSAGCQLQRFWLEATRRGLAMQPYLAPIAFARYAANDVRFTVDAFALARAKELQRRLAGLAQIENHAIFAGRIGISRQREPECRSGRQPLSTLLLPATDPADPAAAAA